MNSLRLAVAASLVAGMGASALAADILVPQDVPNLKDALLTAQPGDRVIVTGGTWRNGRLFTTNVTMVGRAGATLTGLWEVQGTGAAIEGFAVRDGLIEIAGDGVTLRRNRFSAPRYTLMVSGTGVTGATLENNRFSSATVQLQDATNTVLRVNRVSVGELIVGGSGTSAEGNQLVRNAQLGIHSGNGALVAGNRAPVISMHEVDDAIVRDNTIRGGSIGLRGDRALVSGNRIQAGRGLYVTGNDAIVSENRVLLIRGEMSVVGERATVIHNFVDSRATPRRRRGTDPLLVVRGAGPSSVLNNTVRHRAFAGVLVQSDASLIAYNELTGVFATRSLTVNGNQNNIHDNTMRQGAGSDPTASALVLLGDENVVADTTIDGAGYDGVSVEGAGNLLARLTVERAGRCGITVTETGTGNGIADCVVDGARWASLYVLGTDTTITGGSFTGGRKVDVLDLGTGTEFVSATFATKSESEGLRPFR